MTTAIKPTLDRQNPGQIRRVIRSHPGFNQHILIDLAIFRRLNFRHTLFSGLGQELLQDLCAQINRAQYERLMCHLFPEAAAGRFLHHAQRRGEALPAGVYDEFGNDLPCARDPGVSTLLHRSYEPRDAELARNGWRALGGREEESPEETVQFKQLYQLFIQLLERLSPMDARIIRWHLGLDGEELTFQQIGERYGLSGTRIQGIYQDSTSRLFRWLSRGR